ncbi:MAG: HPr(Ser) kinase/phosphatase [Spirochaetales bacterium]|nr:HPr(Ser) kinase/phosphatase [Spirochaetales bacterium]MCF7939258.1 HPr(Ser) kinase/phosphatase [Spirochaetales bacterium]
MDLREHNDLAVRCVAGRPGLVREIHVPDLNRPGLALSGFFEKFNHQRIQLFGRGEYAYLEKLARDNDMKNLEIMFSYQMPCCVFTHNLEPHRQFLDIAEKNQCPVLQTEISSSEFTIRLIRALSNVFAPQQTVHGVLVEVYGIGILIQGESGVGKSETALELVERGHRLVADDVVEIKCVSGNILLGSGANQVLGHHMEVRGLGIINITHLFGVGAIRDQKQIQLMVKLEEWNADKYYDRIGSHEQYTEILGVKVPTLDVPVKPGRNIPIIIETAAMNERLKKMGYYSAKDFNENVLRWLESENARAVYYEKQEPS